MCVCVCVCERERERERERCLLMHILCVQVFSEKGQKLLDDGVFWSLMFVALGGLNLFTNITQVCLSLYGYADT